MSETSPLPPSPLSWAYADAWAEEDPALIDARRQAQSLGTQTPSRSACAALRLFAATLDARAVVEVGTGTGVSGGWLLAGMADDGVLTTVDPDPEHQAAARATFTALGVSHTRVRVIAGRLPDVLQRLTDAAYDLVVVGATVTPDHAVLDQARRLLRPGGALIALTALADSHHDLAQHVRDDPRWVPALLTVGEGMLVAVWRPDAAEGDD